MPLRSRRTCSRLALLGFALLWLVLLWPEATYGGLTHNNLMHHAHLVRRFLAAFHEGSLGLDAWDDTAMLGYPAVRSYQHLTHFLASVLMRFLGIGSASHVLHAIVALAVAFQGVAFYRAARLMGLSRVAALSTAWLAPLVSSLVVCGHAIDTYLFLGRGIVPQAIAVPLFALSFAWSARASGWIDGVPRTLSRDALALGLWTGLTFLFHHFYGYFAVLVAIVLTTAAVLTRSLPAKKALALGVGATAVFVVITGYQLMSLLQDGPLALGESVITDNQRNAGFGPAIVLAFVKGDLLDAWRWKAITGLTLIGAAASFRRREGRTTRALVLVLLLGLVLLAGRPVLGPLVDWVPGLKRLYLERAQGIVHVASLFLAGLGAQALVALAARAPRAARPLPLLLVAGLLLLPFLHSLDFVRRNTDAIVAQTEINATADPRLLGAITEATRFGNLWTPMAYRPSTLMRDLEKVAYLGPMPILAATSFHGVPDIAFSPRNETPGSELIALFKPKRLYHYRLFDVTAVVLREKDPAPPFLEPLVTANGMTAYRAPGAGMFDVVGVPSVTRIPERTLYFDAVMPWVLGNDPIDGNYGAIIPERVAKRWPDAVPPTGQAKKAEWGAVARWERIENGHYRAVLEKTHPEGWGLLRTSYHPRWRVRVNGTPRPPRWAGPGFLAFELDPGRNEVEIVFPPDPVRSTWFLVSMASLAAGLALLLVPRTVLAPKDAASGAWEVFRPADVPG